MNMNIDGFYSFIFPIQGMFLNTEFRITNHNIITKLGEAFFLHRCIDDEFNPLEYVVIGNGNIPPRITDRKLGNERNRKKCVASVDTAKNKIILTAVFTVNELAETTEIGVVSRNKNNGDILISHDVYEKIDPNIFASISGDVTVEYAYQLSTSFQKSSWTLFDESSEVYYAYEETTPLRVFENSSGYRDVGSIDELKNTIGGFYYDSQNKYLYIKPIGDLSMGDIIIQS